MLVIWVRVLENLICEGKSKNIKILLAEVASVAGVILKFDTASTVLRAGTGTLWKLARKRLLFPRLALEGISDRSGDPQRREV